MSLKPDFSVIVDPRGEATLTVGVLAPKTREQALSASIQKWQTIVDFYEEHPGSLITVDCGGRLTCGLCELYNHPPHCCKGCPVFETTGLPGCEDTPYQSYGRRGNDPALAKEELEFLKSLAQPTDYQQATAVAFKEN